MSHALSLRIPTRTLLWVYLIIPLGALLMLIDTVFFEGYLGKHIPVMPETFFWYAILFPYPHIFVSFVSFIDTEYLNYYKWKLALGIPIIFTASLLLPNFSITLTVILFSLATIIHVALQQVGIALMLLAAGRGACTTLWKWSNTLASILIFAMVFPFELPPYANRELLLWASIALLIVASVFSFILLWRGRNRGIKERWYFIGTAMLPVVSLVAVVLGYPIVAIIVARLAHDITAFLFYYTHDYHRNIDRPRNSFTRLFALPVPAYLVSITLLAVLISFTVFQNNLWGISSIFFISMLHYYIESFMWKGGTPHRRVMLA